jgi:hypothetical protein
MAEYLAEQMRSLTRRLEELAQNPLPDTGLEGSLNAKQLAEMLGVNDLQTFTRSMNKIRGGDALKLTRAEMTELAEAFVRLLALEEKETQKVMMALKRVSAKQEPVMEDKTREDESQELIDSAQKLVASHNGTLSKKGSKYQVTIPNLYKDKTFNLEFNLRWNPVHDKMVVDFKGPFTSSEYNEGWSFAEVLPYVIKHFINAFPTGVLKYAPPTNRRQASADRLTPRYIPRG